jgi:hypothetical protein
VTADRLRNARFWHGLTCAVATAAIVLQLILVMRGHQHLGEAEPEIAASGAPGLATRLVRFASYLTIWSNVLAALTTGLLVLNPVRNGRIWRAVRLDAVVIIFGGGVVHFFFLRPLLDLDGADLIADRLLHVVVPLLMAAGWLLFGPRAQAGWRDLPPFLAIPVVWLAYTLIRGAFVHWYPYPFIDVDRHGYGYVALACVGVALLLLALAAGCVVADRALGPAEN